ncbi:MAG: hypothetical protein H6Q08_1815 [Acidobacteria bacterium]|nr:hypothetical protein [Acidobacteriota bacterium]
MPERAGSRESGGGNRSQLRVTLRLIALAVGIRLLTVIVAFWANVVFPPYQREPFSVLAQPHAFWDTFARYDSGWYRGIAQDGYRWVEGGRSNLAFFPVYPMAMRAVAPLFGPRPRHYYFAGIAISWAAFIVAVVLLYRLARMDLDDEAAERAALYAGVFPFAFFFGVVYSESLFLCLMVATFLALRRERWVLAGVLGALAVCTRVNGIMALPAFFWLVWSAGRSRPAPVIRWASVGLVVAGFAAWCAYVYALSGSLIEWKHSIERWGYFPGASTWGPLPDLVQALVTRPYEYLTSEAAAPYDTLNGVTAILFVLSIPFVWWKLGTAYGLFMLANLALPLSSGQFEGLGRYCSVLFPFFIWLAATVRSPVGHGYVVFASSALYALCLSLFTNIHPLF